MDTLIEYVGIKTSLALDHTDLKRIVARDPQIRDSIDFISEHPTAMLRFRPEQLEVPASQIMYAVGATPDPLSPSQLLGKFAQDNPDLVETIVAGPDEVSALGAEFPLMRLQWMASDYLQDREREYPVEFLPLLTDYRARSFFDVWNRQESVNWNGITPLSEIFSGDLVQHSEVARAASETESLVDQRLLNYLRAQPDDLNAIHWRHFELLVGEYLRRQGYDVTVTASSGDGGIDVRARREGDAIGPELVLVQAKRFSSTTVTLDSVKALYSDLDDEHASRGLIVTTNRLEPNARQYCNARQYRLRSAELTTVRDWVAELGRPHRPLPQL